MGAAPSHQGFAVLVDKVLTGACPPWQHHVVHLLVGDLQAAQVEAWGQQRGQRVRKPVVLSPSLSLFPPVTVLVLQELREVEELGDELLDVHGVFHAGLPRRRHRVELPVRAVEPGGTGGTPWDPGGGGGGSASPPSTPHPQRGAHRPLCSWMCSVVKGSVRIR